MRYLSALLELAAEHVLSDELAELRHDSQRLYDLRRQLAGCDGLALAELADEVILRMATQGAAEQRKLTNAAWDAHRGAVAKWQEAEVRIASIDVARMKAVERIAKLEVEIASEKALCQKMNEGFEGAKARVVELELDIQTLTAQLSAQSKRAGRAEAERDELRAQRQDVQQVARRTLAAQEVPAHGKP